MPIFNSTACPGALGRLRERISPTEREIGVHSSGAAGPRCVAAGWAIQTLAPFSVTVEPWYFVISAPMVVVHERMDG